MGWDPVPWMVGGGAQHSAEVGRLLAYVAFRGNEGIVAPADLKVKALDVPGGSVTVDPGACAILCRSSGQLHQAYAGRVASQDTVPIAPTTSSGGRSDLIVARVEDPWLAGEPWPDPSDPANGPYIRSVPIPNVPAGTTTVTQLGLGYSAIPLARIDIPPSTATITQAMITDLRKVANPRRERRILVTYVPNGTLDDVTALNSWRNWPAAHAQQIFVPSWAVQAKIITSVGGALINFDRCDGYIRNRLDNTFGQPTRFDTNDAVGSNAVDKTLMTADELAIPIDLRGTNRTLYLQAEVTYRGPSGTGQLRAYEATTVVSDIEFVEIAE